MKKLYYNLVLTLVAAVLAVGCTEDLTGDVNGAVAGSDFEYIEVTAGLESAESRTTLTDSGNGGKMTWSAGDAIGAIMEDGTITECVATAVDGASATFSVPSGTKYAVYPYASSDTFNAESGLSKTLVNTVTLDGSKQVFDDGQNVMCAHLVDGHLSFRNLCGYIEIKLKGTEVVKHIALRDNSNNWDALSGLGTFDLSDATNPVFTPGTNHGSTYNWMYAKCTDVQLSSSEATSFYLAVPPRAYNNLSICVVTDKGSYSTISQNTITVNRSSIRPLAAIDVDALAPTATTDLSSAGVANCYIVPQSADAKSYSFPARKINGTANLENVAYAHISWSESASLINNVCYDAATGMVSFKYEGNNAEGNAHITLLDASHKIIWYNHIWCTDQPARLAIHTPSKVYAILDRNLGATYTPTTVAEASSISAQNASDALGLYYQYGRPNPYPRANSISGGNDSSAFKGNTRIAVQYAFAVYNQHLAYTSTVYSYADALTYPKMFYKVGYSAANGSESTYDKNGSNYTWYGKTVYHPFNDSDKLWHSENADVVSKKSDNDPCPAGYCVDDQASIETYLIGRSFTAGPSNYGSYYQCSESKAVIWLPYQGFRNGGSGVVGYLTSNYNMWAVYTTSPANNLNCIRVSGNVKPGKQDYTQGGQGFGIRCRAMDRSDLNQVEVVTKTFDGEGTEASPYLIKTSDDLVKLSGLCNGSIEADDDVDYATAHYALGANIDMKGVEFLPITSFGGVLDGKRFTISNLTIQPSMGSAAPFVSIENATIKNVILTNYSVIGTETDTHAGGIAAKMSSGTIENCACYANIEAFCYVGGIVGEVVATGTKVVNIKNCLFKGSLTARKPNGSGYGCGGGIVGCIGNGTNPGEANVTNCVALVDAITCGAKMSYPSVGGLAGYVKKSVFDNCYTNLAVANISMVSGSGNQYGSLYGVTWWAYSPVIKNCYYLADNRIGRDGGTVALENVSGLTIEEMTNGTLLNKLKAVGGDWTANSDGYPVPSGVLPLQ